MLVENLSFLHFDLISVIDILGVSSIYIFALDIISVPLTNLSKSESSKFPV